MKCVVIMNLLDDGDDNRDSCEFGCIDELHTLGVHQSLVTHGNSCCITIAL